MNNHLNYLRHESRNIMNNDVTNRDILECPNKVHDWRNYVPDSLRKIWNELSEPEKLVAVICLNEIARNEEWD